MKRIAIALPISGFAEREIARRDAFIHGLLPHGVEADLLTSPASPRFLDAAKHFAEAVDAAVEFYTGIDTDVYGVVLAAGAIDPGLDRARAACPLPVVGPGEASMFLAHIAGQPLSVVTVDEHAVNATHEFLSRVPAKPPIASVRSMDLPVSRLLQDLDAGRRRLSEVCTAAVRHDGARALYLGSMTLGTLGVEAALQASLGVPVFNPFPIAIAAAIQLVGSQPGSL